MPVEHQQVQREQDRHQHSESDPMPGDDFRARGSCFCADGARLSSLSEDSNPLPIEARARDGKVHPPAAVPESDGATLDISRPSWNNGDCSLAHLGHDRNILAHKASAMRNDRPRFWRALLLLRC